MFSFEKNRNVLKLNNNINYIIDGDLVKSKINILAIGGDGGGYSGPSNLYDILATYFNRNKQNQVCFIRVDIERFSIMSAAKYLAEMINFISKYNFNPIYLMGWSLGGSVIANILKYCYEKNISHNIRGMIFISSVTHETDHCLPYIRNVSKIFFHGLEDDVCTPDRAIKLYQKSQEPKEIKLIKNGSHCYDSFDALSNLLMDIIKFLEHQF